MAHKSPFLLAPEQARLTALGARLRLARKRRRLSGAAMAELACMSRSTVYKVEAGDPGVTLGACFRVLEALGLGDDLDKLAADDKMGRRLQDLALGLTAHGRPSRFLRVPDL